MLLKNINPLRISVTNTIYLIILLEAKPCPSNQKCSDSHAVCFMNPVLPDKAICRCDIREGFKRSNDGTRCIGERSLTKSVLFSTARQQCFSWSQYRGDS